MRRSSRHGGRPVLGARRPLIVPERANQRWTLDFVSDTVADGRRVSRIDGCRRLYPGVSTTLGEVNVGACGIAEPPCRQTTQTRQSLC